MARLVVFFVCIFALKSLVSSVDTCRPITCPAPEMGGVVNLLDRNNIDVTSTPGFNWSPIRTDPAVNASNPILFLDKLVSMATTSVKASLVPGDFNSTYLGDDSAFDFCTNDGSITSQNAFLIDQPLIKARNTISIVQLVDAPYICAVHMLVGAFDTTSLLSMTVSIHFTSSGSITIPSVTVPHFNSTGASSCPVVEYGCASIRATLISQSGNKEGAGNLFMLSFPIDPPDLVNKVEINVGSGPGNLGILAMTGMRVNTGSPQNPPERPPASPPQSPPSDSPQFPPINSPIDPPVERAPDSEPPIGQPVGPPPQQAPAVSPVASPKATPPISQCPPPKPILPAGYDATCVGEQWLVIGNVSFAPTSVTTFLLTPTNLPTIAATGCVAISQQASAQLQIDPQTAITIANNQTAQIVLLQSEAGCLNGKFSNISLSCSDGSSSSGCSPSCVETSQQQTTRSLTVLFVSKCSNLDSGLPAGPLMWWMILLIVVGAVVLIVVAIIIAAAANRNFRRRVFPFLERRAQASTTATREDL